MSENPEKIPMQMRRLWAVLLFLLIGHAVVI
jgi:hypothetical protein